ncbi:MMPL family transporter [Embleya sp. NPDC001921]
MARGKEQPASRVGGGRAIGRVIPWAVIGLWVAAVAVLAQFATGLDKVKSDKVVDYLPSGAESTTVAALEDKLPGGGVNDFVVVYHRAAGITAEDRTTAERHLAVLDRKYPGPPTDSAPSTPAGENGAQTLGTDGDKTTGEGDGSSGRVQDSGDGKALLFAHSVGTASGQPPEYLPALRKLLEDRPAGLETKVTGPGAIEGDVDAVFDGIDEKLMITTVIVVTVLLILIYRSPVLWLLPLLAVGCATLISMAAVYLLAKNFAVVVNEQSAAVLVILVFGVGTDYALLIVARYREVLQTEADTGRAMLVALRSAGPAIIASAGTVAAGLLCLLAADLNSTSGLGPVGAVGIACALIAMLTLFPALLLVLGRWVFWPKVPKVLPAGVTGTVAGQARWDRLGARIDRRKGLAAVGSVVVLGALALGLLGGPGPLRSQDQFVKTPDSVSGFTLVTKHFPDIGGQPITVIAPTAKKDAVLKAAEGVKGVNQVVPGRSGAEHAEITVFPKDAPDSPAERRTIKALRAAVDKVDPAAAVGGPSAQNLDTATTSARDEKIVIPLVLVVITLILGALLRAVVAPVVLILTVVVSFAAAIGASTLVFEHIFNFKGIDPGLPLLGFLFLVALGVDYNIFLMHRAREESLLHGTRRGILGSLSSTGGVITSAGVVLAATFAVLATLPLVPMVELGFLVAFGVLVDTLLVRSILVPAVGLRLGSSLWWPSALGRRTGPADTDGKESAPSGREPQLRN